MRNKRNPELLVKEYENINSRIPYINNGGCGIFAVALYNTFLMLGSKPTLIVITNNYYGMKDDIDTGRILDGLSHIVIRVENNYYDSNGRFDSLIAIAKKYNYSPNISGLECPILIIEKLNLNVDYWNKLFDRRNIKRIINTLDTALLNVLKTKIN